jgi:hypothetical protein
VAHPHADRCDVPIDNRERFVLLCRAQVRPMVGRVAYKRAEYPPVIHGRFRSRAVTSAAHSWFTEGEDRQRHRPSYPSLKHTQGMIEMQLHP